jgi:uncharacterized protein YraI
MKSLLALVVFVAACGSPPPASPDLGDEEGDPTPDLYGVKGASDDGGSSAGLTVGGQARTTATELNLRDGAGTSANVLTVMPCGSTVNVLAGPSTTPVAGWWQVNFDGTIGWASGKYLVDAGQFNPAVCGASAPPPPDGGSPGATANDIFARAKLGVGYSYYWGHGSWRDDGTLIGSCSGTCPSCTHSGQYGADCSGFVAKCWQVPAASDITIDAHPYSTYDFYNSQAPTVAWSQVARSSTQPADAMVYRSGSEGHIVLVESGDPWGNLWLYEARGCATGIVHDLRSVTSAYISIRRAGL